MGEAELGRAYGDGEVIVEQNSRGREMYVILAGRARVEIGTVNADLQENIAAVREVQAFGREGENIEQFRLSNAANRDANIRAASFTSALSPTLEALGYISMAIVGLWGISPSNW